MRTRQLLAVGLAVLCWISSAWPQATAVVVISGSVSDPTGAAVVGAQISAINVATGVDAVSFE